MNETILRGCGFCQKCQDEIFGKFKTIKKGDKFRIIDKDTKKVITEGIALGDVFLDDDEVWKVKVGE